MAPQGRPLAALLGAGSGALGCASLVAAGVGALGVVFAGAAAGGLVTVEVHAENSAKTSPR